MRTLFIPLLALLMLSNSAPATAQQTRPIPGMVRVKIVTGAGAIIVALDEKHAPKTVANFMAYVDDGRLDGTRFYRASRRKGSPQFGFVQGGVGTDYRRTLSPVPLEPTNVTGIKHLDGTISMAHGADPNSGTCNFSIMVGANPGLDARGANRGFAAFGHVIAGMNVVKKLLAMPTGGGSGEMAGQMILKPVDILSVQRLDGTAKPTGRPKPWLLVPRR